MASPKITDRKRETQRLLMQKRRSEARDIEIPKIVNPKRKAAGAKSLITFKKNYFPHLATLKSADFQNERLRMVEHMIRYGGKQAKAEPRGSAKTTDACIAALWALFYGLKRHFFIIKAAGKESTELINDVKRELETNDLLLEDFPEVCAPVRALEGAAQRAGQQTYNGKRTRLVYKSDAIVLPTIDGSKSSGAVFSIAGITGGIRGRKVNGIRPDFCLLDDIEDEESVESETTTTKYEKTVLRSIGGIGGPGKSVAMLWLGTILKRGCLIDRYTDRIQEPVWQGKRQAALIQWPNGAAMKLWEQYEDLYRSGKGNGTDPDAREAFRFYKSKRKEMDAESLVAWPENFVRDKAKDGTPIEISALQGLMNKRIDLGEIAFLTEYQNEPPDPDGESGLTADVVASRLSLYPAHVIPEGYDFALVQGIDIRGREIHFIVDAIKADGTSATIDYDIISIDAPDGNLQDAKGSARPALERATLDALRQRKEVMDAHPYRKVDGTPMEVSLTLVDSGWLTDIVYLFCRQAGPRFRATKGDQAMPGKSKFTMAKAAPTTKVGNNWYAKIQAEGTWLFHLNADHWKLETQERYTQSPETPGAATWFGSTTKEHRIIAKHVIAERWDVEKNKFEVLSRFNHFLDCKAMCRAAANMLGAVLISRESRRIPLAEFRQRIRSSWVNGG